MLLVEDYLVVGGAPFLAQHLPALLHCLRLPLGVDAGSAAGGGVAERGLGPVVRVMETLLVGYPEEGTRCVLVLVLVLGGLGFRSQCSPADHLHTTSISPTRALIDAGVHGRLLQQSLAPPPSSPSASAVSLAARVQFLSVLARSLLTAPTVFLPYLDR